MPIRLENLSKAYGTRSIFSDIHLEIADNEMIAVSGESGSGKSTLLNIIGLLEPFGHGSLVFDNLVNPPMNSLSATRLRRNKIGYLFQNYALAENLTVEQNLKFALAYQKRVHKQNAMHEALADVSLSDTILHQKVYQLSGGEQQRVAIARLFLKPCKVVLADEPTGSLDSKNRDVVISLLQRLHQQGKTVIIVTHDDVVANSCSRKIRIVDSELEEI